MLLGELAERPAGDVPVGDDDVAASRAGSRAAPGRRPRRRRRRRRSRSDVPAGRDRHDVARPEDRVSGAGSTSLVAAADPLRRRSARPGQRLLELRDGPPGGGAVGEPEGADVPLAVGRDGVPASRLRPARQLRLELPALLLQVHLQEPRREAREEPDDEAGPDEVADRVGHRDVVQQARLLGLGEVEPA